MKLPNKETLKYRIPVAPPSKAFKDKSKYSRKEKHNETRRSIKSN